MFRDILSELHEASWLALVWLLDCNTDVNLAMTVVEPGRRTREHGSFRDNWVRSLPVWTMCS